MSVPDVTIIVTPRERYGAARRSFESIAANTPGSAQFIYVMGGAPPDALAFLEGACARHGCELILRPQFLSPTVARNLGLMRARGKYVVFIENDVIVEPGWLDALVRCAEEENADFVGPLCLIGELEDRYLHNAGGRLVFEGPAERPGLRDNHYEKQMPLRGSARNLRRRPTDYVEFHCALIRRTTLDRFAPLDETIGDAAEHIDLALHMRAIGGRGFVEPRSVVSYLAFDYRLADVESYRWRWSPSGHMASVRKLLEKWRLSPNSTMVRDYANDLRRKQGFCLLPIEALGPKPPSVDVPEVARTGEALIRQMTVRGYEAAACQRLQRAYDVAALLFEGSRVGQSPALLPHLVGAASALAAAGANPVELAAALLQAAYRHGVFPTGFDGSMSAKRRWLRRRVGEATEQLAFLGATLDPDIVEPYAGRLDDMPVYPAHGVVLRLALAVENARVDDLDRWRPAFHAIAPRLGGAALLDRLPQAQASPVLELRPLEDEVPDVPVSGKYRTRLSLRAMQALNGGVGVAAPGGLRLKMASTAWTYSAALALPSVIQRSGPATLEVELQVDRGEVGLQVCERGSTTLVLGPELSATAAMGRCILRLDIAAIEEAGDLFLRGWPHEDGTAEATIFRIDVLSNRPFASPVRRLVAALRG